MIEILGASVAVVVILAGLLVLGVHVGNRSWSDEEYEREREGGTALGNAVLATQALFDPGAQHALEQRMVDEADGVESGAPPNPRSGRKTK